MDIDKIMEMLHKELTEDLLSRVKSGAATAAELNVARQLLKDNGIDSVAFKDSPILKLSESLPFADPEAKAE